MKNKELVPTNDDVKGEIYAALSEIGLNLPTLIPQNDHPVAIGLSLASAYKIAREGGRILEYLMNVKKARKEKLISEENVNSEMHRDLLDEYLHLLENEPVNAKKIALLQSIMMASLSGNLDTDKTTAILYFDIAKNFTPGEMLLLTEVYRLSKEIIGDRERDEYNSAHGWLQKVAQKTVLKHSHLVEVSEQLLITKGFITPRTHADQSGVKLGNNLRLTSFALEYCEYLSKGEDILNKIATK